MLFGSERQEKFGIGMNERVFNAEAFDMISKLPQKVNLETLTKDAQKNSSFTSTSRKLPNRANHQIKATKFNTREESCRKDERGKI